MNAYRPITQKEFAEIFPALEKCGIQSKENVFRFVDTELDKIYDVYLLDCGEKFILKKTDSTENFM